MNQTSGYLQVVEGSERCINGHRIIFKTEPGEGAWLCDYDLCDFYYGKSDIAMKNTCSHFWEIKDQGSAHVLLQCRKCPLRWSIG